MFFWLGNRVSEITIASVGTIKTAADRATQYVEDIRKIKADVEQEKQEVSASVAALKTQVENARAETEKIRRRLADRELSDEQLVQIGNKLRSFALQEYQITTFWDLKEPVAISNRIRQALTLAGWKYIPYDSAHFLLGGIAGGAGLGAPCLR
jgi:DNA repair exonuclease SbcCD ATPase subunit